MTIPSSSTTPSDGKTNTFVARALDLYGLSYVRVLPPQKGYRNRSYPVVLPGGGMANFILYKNEPSIVPRIKAANMVADFLAQCGLPARRTLSGKIVRLSGPRTVRYGALYAYLDGSTIAWEAYTQKHIKALGGALSDMHAAWRQLAVPLPSAADEYRGAISRMQKYFGNKDVAGALARKLGLQVSPEVFEHFAEVLNLADRLPGQQPLHMDFVRGNVLFKDEPEVAVSGILDFEKTALGHPVLDIARTLAFLLVDCKYKPSAKVKKHFVSSGYNKRGVAQLPPQYFPLLERLLGLFLFYDFYKFLRHNPYEYLPQNEHFARTRMLLLKRHLISEDIVK